MKLLFIFLTLFSSFYSLAKSVPVKKIYAYKQTILPGKKSNNTSSKETYRIFILSSQTVHITGVWVNSAYFEFMVASVSKKPVILNNGNEKKIAVPITNLMVTEISVKKMISPVPRPGGMLGQLLSKNEIVIVYSFKGKDYFISKKKAASLEPFAAI